MKNEKMIMNNTLAQTLPLGGRGAGGLLVMLTDIGIRHEVKEWEDIRREMQIVVHHDTPDAWVVERAKNADILLTNKVVLKREHLEQLPNLKYVVMASTGTNAVDVDYCHEHGILCSNVPAYSTNSVAQLVFSHLLNIYTHADHYAEKNRKGAWLISPDFCYADSPLHELAGKTIGIVGLGAIGTKVAQIAQSFDMKVLAYTSKKLPPEGEANSPLRGVGRVATLDELYAQCDIITLHCPLVPETKKMINAQSLAKMKTGVVLVNTARGPLVDEHDLYEALSTGKVAAYAADVVSKEPARSDNPIVIHPNVYLTPHNAWLTEEALARLNDTVIRNIKAYLQTGTPINVV